MGGADPDRSHSHVAAPQQSADRAERIDRIAVLNDSLRRSICSPGRNQIVMTAGVAALVGDVSLFRGFRRRAEILRTVDNSAVKKGHPVDPKQVVTFADPRKELQTALELPKQEEVAHLQKRVEK